VVVRYRLGGSTARDIAGSVEDAVAKGALRPGDLVPPIRSLADELGVNPNTAATAYRILRDRGVVETAGRRGTRVRRRPATAPVPADIAPAPAGVRDLSDGQPASRLIPRSADALRHGAAVSAGRGYGAPDVAERFAAESRRRLAADRVPATHLAVVHGTLDAVERGLQAHLRPGDRVAVEDPAWSNLTDLLAAMGLTAEPVAVDDDGMRADALRVALAVGCRAVVVTPRAQVPTGAAVSAPRARALHRVLASYPHTVLVEDDHAADVAGAPSVTLAGTTDHWIHVRSVSKAWGPDLRLAVVAGDVGTVDRLRGRQRLGPGWVSHTTQEAVAELWDSPKAQDLVRRAGLEYAERRTGLRDALAERGVAAHARSGLNVWLPVRDETAAVASLLTAGWAVAPGSRFRLASPPALRITIASLSVGEIPPLADVLARAAVAGPGRGV
jgi:DNA-binding transcriptional MocR family regulator